MQFIKDFIWFIKESKHFTGYSYSKMIFKDNVIKMAFNHSKDMNKWYKLTEKEKLIQYTMKNRTMYFD